MPSRLSFAALAIVLGFGCGTPGRMANLTTAHPDGGRYTFFFTKRLLKFESNDVPAADRTRSYERQLTTILHNDPNTARCELVPDTIDFGEPGSGGAAMVICKGPVPFKVDPISFTMQGDPMYRYWIVGGDGI